MSVWQRRQGCQVSESKEAAIGDTKGETNFAIVGPEAATCPVMDGWYRHTLSFLFLRLDIFMEDLAGFSIDNILMKY
jgi:hypothetical protein